MKFNAFGHIIDKKKDCQQSHSPLLWPNKSLKIRSLNEIMFAFVRSLYFSMRNQEVLSSMTTSSALKPLGPFSSTKLT